MSTAPVVRNPCLSEGEWDRVHAQVQSAFDDLAQRVRLRCPPVIVRTGGRTSGRVWFLYSYREFNLTEDDTGAEDIIAGVDFLPEGENIRIRADIGGAETGDTDYEAPERVVTAKLTLVLTAARELAEELSRQDEVVAKALAKRRSPPDYRGGTV